MVRKYSPCLTQGKSKVLFYSGRYPRKRIRRWSKVALLEKSVI